MLAEITRHTQSCVTVNLNIVLEMKLSTRQGTYAVEEKCLRDRVTTCHNLKFLHSSGLLNKGFWKQMNAKFIL
jgi:hypothetical protein